MLSVVEALEILKKEEITSSIQVLRRWLRAGKIPGAFRNTLKEGWQIPENSLQSFIITRSNNTYQCGYEKGYADAMKLVEERDRRMLSLV
ncbi:hypothetical protein GT375_14150 [Listeria monocytogenes]|nr:hypothetical protein [Listeria monocytogenes]